MNKIFNDLLNLCFRFIGTFLFISCAFITIVFIFSAITEKPTMIIGAIIFGIFTYFLWKNDIHSNSKKLKIFKSTIQNKVTTNEIVEPQHTQNVVTNIQNQSVSVFSQSTDNVHRKTTASTNHENTMFPNGNTIVEQQQLDYQITQGNYPIGTPSYLGMRIISNTIPAQENYYILNENEQLFFKNFCDQLIVANLSPSNIKLTRLSNGGFNVDYIGVCYVGKINLYILPTTYAVIKTGNQRATKVFNSKEKAEEFIFGKEKYNIQVRTPKPEIFMQYLCGQTTIKNLHDISLTQCIELIPYWIRYIKYCKRN